MSRCFTLDDTGLSNGIVVHRSSTPGWPHSIGVGRDYRHDLESEWDTLITDWRILPLDHHHPPTLVECRDGTSRVVRASIITVKDRQFVRAAYPGQRDVLVRVDTGHTEPCETGGDWVVKSGNPQLIMKGKVGQHVYRVHHRGGSFGIHPFDERVEEVDNRAAWNVGVLRLAPGDSLEVIFKAPGEVVGLLSCVRPGDVRFELTTNKPDTSYEWESPNYQEERDIEDDRREYERRHQDPSDV
jgi:hypothetical protein